MWGHRSRICDSNFCLFVTLLKYSNYSKNITKKQRTKKQKTGLIYLHFEMGRSKFIWGFECLACPHALDFKETLFCLQFLSVFVFLFFWSGFWRTRGNEHQKSGLIYVYFELACSKFIWGFEFLACYRQETSRNHYFSFNFGACSFFYFCDQVFDVQDEIKTKQMDWFIFILIWHVLNSFEDLNF